MTSDPLDSTDLMPPPFADGLDDWSRGDGTPESATYDRDITARIARGDEHFGTCLELRKTDRVQRLRYMGEVPVRPGAYLEISVRLKVMRGSLPLVQIAAWPGVTGGRGLTDLPSTGALVRIPAHGVVVDMSAVIGPEVRPGVDLVWDVRARYAHVGLDLLGPEGGVVRVADIAVRDVTRAFEPRGRVLAEFRPKSFIER